MKKLIITLSIAIIGCAPSFAQWSGTTDIYNTNLGNVGIGTSNMQVYSGYTTLTIGDNNASRAGLFKFRSTYNSGNGAEIYQSTSGMVAINTNSTTNALSILAGGNVGIGTANPLSKLDINGGVAIGSYAGSTTAPGNGLIISGNVGIGTTTPSTALEVWDSFLSGVPASNARYQNIVRNSQNQIYVGVEGSSGGGIATGSLGGAGVVSSNSAKPLQLAANSAVAMTILQGGNVLIGKTSQSNPSYKLDIAGTAMANEIVVNSDGADFVFKSDYKLPKLSEVKRYIDKNHHLPEIPSAAEMQKNGMGLGELNTKLLQKVEELTLYLIKQKEDADKQNQLQQKQIAEQKSINKSLQKQINRLAKRRCLKGYHNDVSTYLIR